MNDAYDSAFYAQQKDGSYVSASVVVPHILSLFKPSSVADFGCGVGTWLRALLDVGVTDITGVDGDYVRDELLVIPSERFVRADLTRPIDLGRTFDLVVSLEVREHLPKESAPVFVQTLTRHSKVVLFSAAIPFQGGTYHINEQWPQYWNGLFSEHGYSCVDSLRGLFWHDDRIEWWYRQNMLLFVANDTLSGFSSRSPASVAPLDLVHPALGRGRR
jgi:SAM-dependent methyltransferase